MVVKMLAFRDAYGRLAELRALFPSSVPMAALTATANSRRSPDHCDLAWYEH